MSKHRDVVFTEPGEFAAELARDHARGLVERGFVRVTKVGRPAMNGTITRVTVEAADRRQSLRTAALPVQRVVCGAWTATSRCSIAPASSSASSRASCSTAASSSAPASATTDRWRPRPRPTPSGRVAGLAPSRPQPSRRSHVNDHFHHPGGRRTRGHACVPRRPSDRRRPPGAGRARPGRRRSCC
jgi:hypothetical protein